MNIRKKIEKFWSNWNPLARLRRKNLRKGIINRYASLFCPNCIGGHLFHDLGLQFRSPTVNLMIFQPHFVKFVLNMDKYFMEEFVPYYDSNFECPCAHLDDIVVHFTHYDSVNEGISKWRERLSRVDKQNIFVFLTERDGLTYEEIKSLAFLDVRGLVVFTAHEYRDIPYALYIPKYNKDGEVGNILRRSNFDDHREYEEYFDFVKWFNEANGGDYNIQPYIKRKRL